jgi:hypothetical protein
MGMVMGPQAGAPAAASAAVAVRAAFDRQVSKWDRPVVLCWVALDRGSSRAKSFARDSRRRSD